MPSTSAAACLALTLCPALAHSAPPVFEGFDDGANGWVWADMNCGGPYLNPVATGLVIWYAAGGIPGGHISAADPSGNCYYFRAAPAFTGDLSAYLGGTVGFSIFSTLDNYTLERSVLLVGANGVTLAAPIQMPALNAWSVRSVTLAASSFRVNSQSGPPRPRRSCRACSPMSPTCTFPPSSAPSSPRQSCWTTSFCGRPA